MSSTFTAAVLQICATRSINDNCEKLLKLAQEAVEKGANLLQSPEMSNLVERDKTRLMAAISPENEEPMLLALRAFAKKHGIVFHIGSLAVREGEKVANRGFVINPQGEISARYDKIHLFDVDLPNGESWRESATYLAGQQAVLVQLPSLTKPAETNPCLGLAICYDLRFPALFAAQAQAGANILTAPACFTRQTGEAHWHILQRARAIETGCFMLSAAQTGLHEDGRETFGHSLIIDPWGGVLADAGQGEGIGLAKINLDEVKKARERIPTLRHARPILDIKTAPEKEKAT